MRNTDKILSLNQLQIENFKFLGLIWGFLKYYHPAVGTGKYDWDKELFRLIPEMQKVKSSAKRDKILFKWILSLGKIEISDNKCAIPKKDIKVKPDLDWINNSGFSQELQTVLNKVINAKRTGKNYYVKLVRNIGNPKFKNENKYKTKICPDINKRMLTLLRYWNMVQYFFPYKYLIEEDWKVVLEKFIPKFNQANNEKDYLLTILELITHISDTHADIGGENYIMEKIKGDNFAPIDLSYIENKAIVTGFYHEKYGKETALKNGDTIISVEGKPVGEIMEEKLKFAPASNYISKVRLILMDLLRTNASEITVEIERENKIFSKKLKTFNYNELNFSIRYRQSDIALKMIRKDISYLDNGALKRKDIPDIWDKIKNTNGIIIDCRQYPHDYPYYELCNYLLPKEFIFCKFSEADISQPGLFNLKNKLSAGKINAEHYKGKIIILVNEISISSAEFHAMAYKVHPNSIIIGSTTAGADGNVSLITLPGNVVTGFTGIGIYYPDGAETQRIGIVPDIEIKPTIKGIREGRDELIEKAIEIIDDN